MQLRPRRPPGRAGRKAWQYAGDIQRLRAEGYSLEAIRLALLDVGVTVSPSTVRREAARNLSSSTQRLDFNADAASRLEDVGRASDPMSETEAIAQLLDKLLDPLERPASCKERKGNVAQQHNQQRSFVAWLMGRLHGMRRVR